MTAYVFDITKSIAEAGQQARTFANGYYFSCRVNSDSYDKPIEDEHHDGLAAEFAQWYAQLVADYYLNGGNLPMDISTAFWVWTADV